MNLGFPTWVGVVCEDLEGQGRFYEDVLGMRVVGAGEDWVHIDLGTGPHFELLRRSTEHLEAKGAPSPRLDAELLLGKAVGLSRVELYMHLDRVDAREGAVVERGETLGTVGSTGRATGPHLHFQVQAGRSRVDPATLFALPVGD